MSDPGTLPAGLAAALLMGLLGSPHCIGMCGGIATALAPPLAGPGLSRWRTAAIPVALGLGRVGSYALLGAAVGAIGDATATAVGLAAGPPARVVLGSLFILFGLSVSGWWPGALAWLERPAAKLWSRIAPLAKRTLPIEGAGRALLAGGLWGLLPCGLVYGALAGAAVLGSAAEGALWMAAFGLGTLPAVLGASLLGGGVRALAARRNVRSAAGALLIAAGLWTLASPVGMQWLAGAHAGHHDAHHGAHDIERVDPADRAEHADLPEGL